MHLILGYNLSHLALYARSESAGSRACPASLASKEFLESGNWQTPSRQKGSEAAMYRNMERLLPLYNEFI